MHLRPKSLLVLALATAVAACGERPPTEIELQASPARIEVGEGKYVKLDITGRFNGRPLLSGSTITLETDLGAFSEGGDDQVYDAVVQGNSATARLYSPSRPGTATVTAKYIDPYSETATSTIEVVFTTPAVTSLNFSCNSRNIGAFVNSEDINVRCDATPMDAEQKMVRFAQVRFLAEAGGFRRADEDETGRMTFIYDPRLGGEQPKDVPPLGDDSTGEPRWVDLVNGGVTRNPRDGLVTLVAYVAGEANGVQGEPYVDANDNKIYDEGEKFEDLNKNGIWDEIQEEVIWKQIKILWTGKAMLEADGPQSNVTIPDGSPDIDRGSERTFVFRLLDRNFNVLAANGGSDAIEFESSYGTIVGSSTVPLKLNAWGMDINGQYQLNSPSSRNSYMLDSNYSVRLRNSLSVDEQPTMFDLQGYITRNHAVDESGAATGDPGFETTPVVTGTLR